MAKQASPSQVQAYPDAKLFSWVKALEAKVNSLRREFDLIKHDMLNRKQEWGHELKQLRSEITQLRHAQEKHSAKMDLIIKELSQTAGKEELQVIKKYLDLWNPLEFVTQRDIERILEMKAEELGVDLQAVATLQNAKAIKSVNSPKRSHIG